MNRNDFSMRMPAWSVDSAGGGLPCKFYTAKSTLKAVFYGFELFIFQKQMEEPLQSASITALFVYLIPGRKTGSLKRILLINNDERLKRQLTGRPLN